MWDFKFYEGGHSDKIYNMFVREYLNHRGVKRVEHMMEKMYLITSPKYSGKYTTEKDNK